MKKTKFYVKKTIAFAATALLCLATTPPMAAAPVTPPTIDGDVVPQNIAIIFSTTLLKLGNLGKLICYGSTEVQNGYTAGVAVELQQDGRTIKTWSDSCAYSVAITQNYYVASGHTYQLKVTHTAYNAAGSKVESFVKYSNVVNY